MQHSCSMRTPDELFPAGGYVSDGGLETDLIFHRGLELPEFASFPLVEHDAGRDILRSYFDGYVEIARAAGAGLTLESPTWRANPDWGAQLGYDAAGLDRVNRAAIEFLSELRTSYGTSRTRWSSARSVLVVTVTSPASGPTLMRRLPTTGPRSSRSPAPAPTWWRPTR